VLCAFAGREASAADLTVEVAGLRSAAGQVLIALHNSSASFPSRWARAAAVKRVPAVSGVTVRFENVPPGRYAVIAVHDEDGDGEMTKTLIGLPVEGFGTSNNPSFFGPPRFSSSAFDLTGDAAISIRIVYF
jgi:uncharacterized protein (DUF2141 family)